ncbi:MAG: hypothetical protein SCH39_13345 [Methanosarcinales archaeon]|nr:hypothetical protein [Methanosarcinales archaeon]
MDKRFSAYRWLLRYLEIIHNMELGKPVALPNNLGRSSVRSDDGAEGRGIGKKRRAACNELHRGSKFALT